MTRLAPETYLSHLSRDSSRFRAVLGEADPTAQVPACPDWQAADLLWHLAEVQWFWASTITARPAQHTGDHPARPASYAALLTTFDEYSARLVDALTRADPEEPAWHWGPEQDVAASYRRQAHEALIHRVDAEQTAGVASDLDDELAADGVVEMLEWMYGGLPPAWAAFTPTPGLVRLDLTDTGDELWVQPGAIEGVDPDSGRELSGPHLLLVDDPGLAAAATLTGPAGVLDAWLWQRGDDTAIVRAGDPTVLAAFTAATAPPIE